MKRTVQNMAQGDEPQFFRLTVEVGNLEAAVAFYGELRNSRGPTRVSSSGDSVRPRL